MVDLLQRLQTAPVEGTFGGYSGDRSAGISDFPGFAQLSPAEQKAVEAVRKGQRPLAIMVRGDELLLFEHAEAGVASDYTDGARWGYTVRRRSASELKLPSGATHRDTPAVHNRDPGPAAQLAGSRRSAGPAWLWVVAGLAGLVAGVLAHATLVPESVNMDQVGVVVAGEVDKALLKHRGASGVDIRTRLSAADTKLDGIIRGQASIKTQLQSIEQKRRGLDRAADPSVKLASLKEELRTLDEIKEDMAELDDIKDKLVKLEVLLTQLLDGADGDGTAPQGRGQNGGAGWNGSGGGD